MAVHVQAELVGKEQLKPDIYRFTIESKEIAKDAMPGHFLEIKVSDLTEPLLRRPISIYHVDKENDMIAFIFQVKGKGTEILAQKQVGDTIDTLGPLGYGTFEIKENAKVAILGGGIGVFPLYELAKRLREKNTQVDIYLGFRGEKQVVLEDEFSKIGNELILATDDGSYGKNGFAIQFLAERIKEYDMIYSCGPLPMLKALQKLAAENSIPCQISLEERMGCGIGACLGCAVKVISGKEPRYGHVCKEGPVFYANEVEI